MDLSFLDKSSQVTPLLRSLYENQKLESLEKNPDCPTRGELTNAVCELLETQLSARESEMVADVLIALVRQAEIDLRAALSERLSIMDQVPLRLVLELANDTIFVARPVLKKSSVLGDLDLIYIIKSKETDHWQAIASREDIGKKVIDALADTEDADTAITLIENHKITLTQRAIHAFVGLAQKSDSVAMPLLARDEIEPDLISKIYACAGKALKKYIQDSFEGIPGVEAQIDDIEFEFADMAKNVSDYQPTKAMMAAARALRISDRLNIDMIVSVLKRGQLKSFVALFSVYCKMPAEKIIHALEQKNGRNLAIICRGFHIQKPDFLSIYLLTNKIRSGNKMVDLGGMNYAIKSYDVLKSDMAKKIILKGL